MGDEKKSLPEGWRWVPIKEVCEVNPRRSGDLRRADEVLTTFVPMAAVDDVTGTIAVPIERPFREVKKGYTYFEEGDILFSKITPCMENGKHALARGLTDGIGFGTTEFHVLRPGGFLRADWLHLYLRRPEVLHEAANHFTGAVGQQRVPPGFLADLEFPLPPLPEQERIAAILTEQLAMVERARKASEARLEAARALPAAYLREMFDREEARGWPKRQIDDFAQTKSGTTPLRSRREFYGGDIPWVKTGELRDGLISKAEETVTELAQLPQLELKKLGNVLIILWCRIKGRHYRLVG